MANEDMLNAVIKSYQDKLRANPDSLTFVQLADAYRKKGDLDAALRACQDGLARHPNLLSGLLMQGRVFSARREYDDAVETLKRVIQREPNNLTAHALLSQSYLALGRYSDAIGEYQKILSLNPEDSSSQQALRDALERMRREGSAPARPAGPPVAAGAGSAPRAGGAVAVAPAEPEPDLDAAPDEPPAQPAPSSPPPALSTPQPAPASRQPAVVSAAMQVPAFAAAEQLAERGLYDEAIEAFQRILEADPDNFMARQKLREVYAHREAMEGPSSAQEPAAKPAGPPAQAPADKISDEEILYLLGLMEDAATPAAPPVAKAAVPVPAEVAPPSRPAAPSVPEAAPAPQPAAAAAPSALRPEPAAPVPVVAAAAPSSPPVATVTGSVLPEGGPPAAREPKPALAAAAVGKVTEILDRLSATEGMRQAFLVAGQALTASGRAPDGEHAAKIVMLVGMLSDVTRRAAVGMKQGEVKQVLVFGTEGIVMVSPAAPGTLAAVAGAGVNVGRLRLALNDCLKRLGEVS